MNTFWYTLSLAGCALLALVGLFALIFLMYAVHCALENYCYIPYAKRFCRRHSLVPVSWRCGMTFRGGVKTEYSAVELHCLDLDQQEHLVQLLVQFLGVKAVLKVEPPMADPALQPKRDNNLRMQSMVKDVTRTLPMNDDPNERLFLELRKLRGNLQVISTIAVLTILVLCFSYGRPRAATPIDLWSAARAAADRLEFEQAAGYVQQIVAKYPGDYNGYAYLGNIELITGHVKQAEFYYTKADSLFPSEQYDKMLATIRARLDKEANTHLPGTK